MGSPERALRHYQLYSYQRNIYRIESFEDGQLDVATLSGELAQQNKNNTLYHSYPTATMNYLRLNQNGKGKQRRLQTKTCVKHWL